MLILFKAPTWTCNWYLPQFHFYSIIIQPEKAVAYSCVSSSSTLVWNGEYLSPLPLPSQVYGFIQECNFYPTAFVQWSLSSTSPVFPARLSLYMTPDALTMTTLYLHPFKATSTNSFCYSSRNLLTLLSPFWSWKVWWYHSEYFR